MTTPLSEWTCFHCGQRCGGKLPTGYRALTGLDMPTHATCSPAPADLAAYPDCWRRVMIYHEPPGALREVRPLPVGVRDLRSLSTRTAPVGSVSCPARSAPLSLNPLALSSEHDTPGV